MQEQGVTPDVHIQEFKADPTYPVPEMKKDNNT